jgi:molybdenum cofactor biosynthesis enzyme MoaA
MNVNLELTDHCNLRCRMCSQSLREEAHGAPHRFMEFDTWRDAVGGLSELDDVTLCPHWLGEPTLHPDFDRFVEHAFAENGGNRQFRHFKLHTNAVIFPEARAALLTRLAAREGQSADTFLAIHFSIDAFSPEVYAQIKGADRREVVFRNVDRFLSVRGAAARPVAHVAFVVQDGNVHEAAAFVEHWMPRLRASGREPVLTGEWPRMDADAVYLRRWNTGDQRHADALHAEACRSVGLPVAARAPGSF